jgi:dihydroxyacetone kinase
VNVHHFNISISRRDTEKFASMATATHTFHLVDDLSTPVQDALSAIPKLYSHLSIDVTNKIVFRADVETFSRDHVTTVACSGGGHEPMFSGFVGTNFCTAFVSGTIFASPTARQMLASIKLCQRRDSPHGTMLLVANYTGDILNAGLALTRARAEGYKVELVVVGDDVAVGREKVGKVGRRGMSGHILALKAACAAAENGSDLETVVDITKTVADRVGTVGVAFDK